MTMTPPDVERKTMICTMLDAIVLREAEVLKRLGQ